MTNALNMWPWLGGVLVSVALGGAIVTAVCGDRAATHAETSPHVDATQARYRYAVVSVDETAELASTIAALEARHRGAASPFDAGELADVYYQRAQVAGDRADLASSERYARESLAILRKPNTAVVTLAKIANARHQFREAIELAGEQLVAKPTPAAHLVIATAQLARGELGAAAAAADRAIAMRGDANGNTTRALVRQAQGRETEAAADFVRAASAEQAGDRQGAARLRALWGRFLIRRGDYAGARIVIDESLRIVPDHPMALAQRGELALRTGKPADAAKLFERAFERSRQVRYLMDEARARELAGGADAAVALRVQVEAIVRRELADDALGHQVDLVEVLADRGDAAALAEAVRRGRDELARRGSFDVRFQLARALYRSGRIDEAAAEVQAALAMGTREAQLFELASRIEHRRGNAAGAATYTALADELDPKRSGWRALGLGGS